MELVPDMPADPAERAASRTTDGRQRLLAALVVGAAVLLVYALSAGPWATARLGADGTDGADGSVTEVDLRLSGEVDVDPAGGPVADDLDPDSPARVALEEAMGGATRDLTTVLAVLIFVVAAVGVALDLRSRLWALLTSASLVCLLGTAVLRDRATSALAGGAASLEAGPFTIDPTGWSGVAIGAAAVAALASFLATAERGVAGADPTPVLGPDAGAAGGDPGAVRRRPSTPAGRVRARLLNSLPSRESRG